MRRAAFPWAVGAPCVLGEAQSLPGTRPAGSALGPRGPRDWGGGGAGSHTEELRGDLAPRAPPTLACARL